MFSLCRLKAVKAILTAAPIFLLSSQASLFLKDIVGRNGNPGDDSKVVKCPKFKFLHYELLKLVYIKHLKHYFEKKLKYFYEAFFINGL